MSAMILKYFSAAACAASFWAACAAHAADAPMPLNKIGAVKLIIGDVKQNQSYFEQMFGMKEIDHYSGQSIYDEPIMAFDEGAHLALFSPKQEPPLKKSAFPVALIYTPDLEVLVKRMQDADYPVRMLDAAQTGAMRIAIARDPSGNAIEILARPGKRAVGGAKLIVNNRQKAEEFYAGIFNATAGQRYKTPAYDEVLMNMGDGPFLALFQPLAEPALPKSKYPVVAIYTAEFEAVLKRVADRGLGYRDVPISRPGMRIIVATDPAGNAVEIIRQAPATAIH
jgi:catechol 2,3-dioxygenase-like lactoylglutathione lyase family enzyme